MSIKICIVSVFQAGVAVNAADFKGLTPLMTACMFGKFATAAFLLGSGALGHLTDINGDTALHWAAYKGHAELIRLLMYSGVDLQKPDYFGSTPLHLACLSSNVSCVKILCEKSKIELEPRDKNGKTPLQLAKSHRHSEIVRILQAEQKRRARWIPPINELWFILLYSLSIIIKNIMFLNILTFVFFKGRYYLVELETVKVLYYYL